MPESSQTLRSLVASCRQDLDQLTETVAQLGRLVDPFITETSRLPTSEELTTAMQQRIDAMLPVLQSAVANAATQAVLKALSTAPVTPPKS